jgi:4-diphosphocytidyl-2-C-methyl-D-erythritol kinase
MIDLCDLVTFRPEPFGKVRVTCSDKSIPARKNLAYLAAMALWRPGLPGVGIHIEKRIPSGAGLGGGSSNAATVLWVLNRVWRLGLSNLALRKIGATLGADVPFFLFAPRAWVAGVGDRLTELPPAEKFAVLLVKPSVKVPTKKAYKDFDSQLTRPLTYFKISPYIRQRGFTLDKAVGLLQNDLENTVLNAYPVLVRVKRELRGLQGKGVMLTGSGSAVFALFKNKKDALSANRKIAGRFPWWSAVASPRVSMAHKKKWEGEQNGNYRSCGKADR